MAEFSSSHPPTPPTAQGRPPGRPGIGAIDVHKAADELLRQGQRPTVERIRTRVGRGSPNTIQPLLDDWWSTLGARLDAGPAALHRIPESMLHIVEALWLQVLEEARLRTRDEASRERSATDQRQQELAVRSYVLSLREGELAERLRSQDRRAAQLRDELAAAKALISQLQAERTSWTAKKPALGKRNAKAKSAPLSRKHASPRAARSRSKKTSRPRTRAALQRRGR